VLAGGVTLAVGTADGLHERHRAHAALVALGTPMSVLRRSVVLQVATPLLLTVALAVASSAVAARVYLELGDVSGNALRLPWSGYGAIALAAIAATLLATAAALPLLRAAGRPGSLRME
jgi:predicted lysophospholipase L1 biosynthesis ABC-type transport system permease subunit